MTFYLGTHQVCWLARTSVPLFLSRRRLAPYKALPRAQGPWCLDSGGFSELSLYGQWTLSPRDYGREVRRFHTEIGRLEWATCQDWMCEPVIRARTGLSVAEHQRRTTLNYRELCQRFPELPWAPVLQGWETGDYPRHRDGYAAAGVDLEACRVVGLGSVCRRQHTPAVASIVASLPGLRLHGFGVKTAGLQAAGARLFSADSLAWSYGARRSPPLSGCRHRSCANCLRWALRWREKVLATTTAPWQEVLPGLS